MLFFLEATAQKKHLIYVTQSESFWTIFFSQSDQCLSVSSVPFKAVTLQFDTLSSATAPLSVTSANFICSALCKCSLQLLIMLKSWKLNPSSVNWVSEKEKVTGCYSWEYEGCGTSHSHGCTKFLNSRNHLKILGARWVTWNNVHTDDSQILGTTIKYLVAYTTGSLGICAPLAIPLLPWTLAKCRVSNGMSWWRNQSPVHHFSDHLHQTLSCRHCRTTV